jgi:hypothetical protein
MGQRRQQMGALSRVLTTFAVIWLSSVCLSAPMPKMAGIKAGFKSGSEKSRQLRPTKEIEVRVQNLYDALMSRPPRVEGSSPITIEISGSPGKSQWLAAVYSRNLVEASEETKLLSDKLLMAKVLEKALGEKSIQFLPKTLGLKEFLDRNHLVSRLGKINVSGEQIEQALYKEFPAGFVIRPAVGVAPSETTKGLFNDTDTFVSELVAGKFQGYEPEHFWKAVKSHILDTVASGEAVVLEDDIILKADAHRALHAKAFREIRIHTFESKVVADAVPARWVQKAKVDESEIKSAEALVQTMLDLIPPRLLTRQAWGIDVAVFDNGDMVINDIVTNRGRRIQWSSYLEQPRVIGAYTRHFESFAKVDFSGISGMLARNNLGNYFSYWHTRIEKSPPGFQRLLSYLPPIP